MCTLHSAVKTEPDLELLSHGLVGSGTRTERGLFQNLMGSGPSVPVPEEYKYEYLSFSFPNGYWMLHKAVKGSNLFIFITTKVHINV